MIGMMMIGDDDNNDDDVKSAITNAGSQYILPKQIAKILTLKKEIIILQRNTYTNTCKWRASYCLNNGNTLNAFVWRVSVCETANARFLMCTK